MSLYIYYAIRVAPCAPKMSNSLIALVLCSALQTSLGWTSEFALLRSKCRSAIMPLSTKFLRKGLLCKPVSNSAERWPRSRAHICSVRTRKRDTATSAKISIASTRQSFQASEDPFFAELLTDDGLRMSEAPFRWKRVNWGGLLLSTLKSRIMRRVFLNITSSTIVPFTT